MATATADRYLHLGEEHCSPVRTLMIVNVLQEFIYCISIYASGKLKLFTAINRQSAGTEDSVYPSLEYSKTLSGRGRYAGGVGAGVVVSLDSPFSGYSSLGLLGVGL
jgi:hypothetical protein